MYGYLNDAIQIPVGLGKGSSWKTTVERLYIV